VNSLDWETALLLTYVWIKAAHVIFAIFWIAGLFMLPRYYIYHQESPENSPEEKKWIEREKKLRNIIITPAMILVWVFGISLAFITDAWGHGWFQVKFAVVIALSAYHGWMVRYGNNLANGQRPSSGKALRIMNEAPGIATAIIIILVIVRPF
jgi:putative membrane protein